MSRVGKMSIKLPVGVTITVDKEAVTVSGPKGQLTLKISDHFQVAQDKDMVTVLVTKPDQKTNQQHGLTRSLINNAILGVTQGWEKTVELVGVGYRATGGGSEVVLTVGFTHPVKVIAPPDTSFTIIENTKIKITGIDKKVVGEVAAKLRNVKPPEPYKGKGIRYLGEVIRKKAGKAVKAIGTAS